MALQVTGQVSVRSQFHVVSKLALFLDPPSTSAASLKTGATAFPSVNQYTVFEPDEVCEPYSGFGREGGDDTVRLNTRVMPINRCREVIGNEGDVRRFFAKYVSGILRLACPDELEERAETGPIQQTHLATTVDSRLSFGNQHAVIVQLKRPGAIIVGQWDTKELMNSQQRLGKEIRMYAFQYKCPHVCLFDGCTLLMVRFRANNANQIRLENCPIDCCTIPITYDSLEDEDQPEGPENRRITILYALYLMIREGINRIKAANGPQIIELAGYRRHFQWYDSKPTWVPVAGGQTSWNHPGGYQRRYDAVSKRWYWSLDNANYGWDTN